jgi:hypothetical protein
MTATGVDRMSAAIGFDSGVAALIARHAWVNLAGLVGL